MGIETIIAAVAAVGSLAGGLKSAGVFGGDKSPAPTITAAPSPAGPAADLTSGALAGMRPSSVNEPGFLRFPSGMTSLQKRAQIATYGTQSGDSRYTDPAAKQYLKDEYLNTYDPVKGLPGGILPVERQYASNVFGVQPRNDSTESFLSAILRG